MEEQEIRKPGILKRVAKGTGSAALKTAMFAWRMRRGDSLGQAYIAANNPAQYLKMTNTLFNLTNSMFSYFKKKKAHEDKKDQKEKTESEKNRNKKEKQKEFPEKTSEDKKEEERREELLLEGQSSTIVDGFTESLERVTEEQTKQLIEAIEKGAIGSQGFLSKLSGGLTSLLGGILTGSAGVGALFGGSKLGKLASKIPGVGKLGGAIGSVGGKVASAAKFGAKRFPLVAAALAGWGGFKGWGEAKENFETDDPKLSEKISSTTGGIVNSLSMGFISKQKAAKAAQFLNPVGIIESLFPAAQKKYKYKDDPFNRPKTPAQEKREAKELAAIEGEVIGEKVGEKVGKEIKKGNAESAAAKKDPSKPEEKTTEEKNQELEDALFKSFESSGLIGQVTDTVTGLAKLGFGLSWDQLTNSVQSHIELGKFLVKEDLSQQGKAVRYDSSDPNLQGGQETRPRRERKRASGAFPGSPSPSPQGEEKIENKGNSGPISAISPISSHSMVPGEEPTIVNTKPAHTEAQINRESRNRGYDSISPALSHSQRVEGIGSLSSSKMQMLDKRYEKGSERLAQYDEYFQEASRETGIPVHVLKSIANIESNGNPNAKSPAGAMGLMQLMPAVQKEQGVTDPFDPRQSILAGARHYKKGFDKYGNHAEAMAAYNTGINRKALKEKRYGDLSKETQDYMVSAPYLANKYLEDEQKQYAQVENSNTGFQNQLTAETNKTVAAESIEAERNINQGTAPPSTTVNVPPPTVIAGTGDKNKQSVRKEVVDDTGLMIFPVL